MVELADSSQAAPRQRVPPGTVRIPARNRDREIGVRSQETFDHLDDRLRRIGPMRIQHNEQFARRRVHPLAERGNPSRACHGNDD